MNQLDRHLSIAAEAERSKTLKQFQDWDAQVHCTIQRRIDEALNSMDSKTINERRRGDLEKFLATANAKAAVFRDIIIESGRQYCAGIRNVKTHDNLLSGSENARVQALDAPFKLIT